MRNENWHWKSILEICNPKQWPTISTIDLKTKGYPVFGANGQIGLYDEYNHEFPTILITCRGATCGTINISPPKTYITGNAMSLDDLKIDLIDFKFLYFYLKHRGLNDVITGAAQPQITRINLQNVFIPIPTLEEQKIIVDILIKIEDIYEKQNNIITKASKLISSIFHHLFGDILEKNYNKTIRIKDLCKEDKKTIDDKSGYGIPYLGLENIESNTGRILIDEQNAKNKLIRGTSFVFDKNHILFGKLRPYLVKIAIPNFDGRCSTELVPLLPINSTNKYFLAELLRQKSITQLLMLRNRGARMPRADMNILMELEIKNIPINAQNKFADIYLYHFDYIEKEYSFLNLINTLYSALLSKAFDGSLTAKWRESNMKEILQETENQKNY